jgi:hypothetical protein
MSARLALLALVACDPDPVPLEDPTACDHPRDDACLSDGPLFVTDAERDAAQAETDRLAEIQDRHQDEIFAEEGVLSMGIGWDCEGEEFVFVVGYDEDGSCPGGLPLDLEGVPIRVYATQPVFPL